MKRLALAGGLLSAPLALAFLALGPTAQAQRPGWVVVPDSSVERSTDVGRFAHTNHLIFIPAQPLGHGGGGTALTPAGLSPQQARSAYGLSSTGGGGIIAIVDAFHDPYALSDFNTFSSQYRLPQETSTSATASTNTVFQVVYASGSKPRFNSGWSQEESLDIEWAHAMAPNAKIVLVEAASNSFSNLFAAVDKSVSIGANEVSMSWGGSEFSGESGYDSHFASSSIVFFASSGDTGGKVIYPSASPNVVSAGGTSLTVDSNGNWISETGWSGSGGGPSAVEPRPSYQDVVSGIVGSRRGTPDLSFDSDPNTGVAVVWSGGWYVFGGTSVASPSLAGIANLAGVSGRSSSGELTKIYAGLGGASFHDIVGGTAGSFSCAIGWDFVTGVGTPNGVSGL